MARVNGMTPAVARLMELADGRLSRAEVASRLGYTRNGLCATLHQARLQKQKPRFLVRRQGGSVTIAALVRSLPGTVRVWFEGEISAGGCQADAVRALVVEAYNAEQDAKSDGV